MTYKREGYCSQCGDCCRSAHIAACMSQKNNVIDGVQYCDYVRKENGLFICGLIEKFNEEYEATVEIGKTLEYDKITEAIKDELSMSTEQVLWCYTTLSYPNPKLAHHCPPRHYIKRTHPNCTFGLVEI